MGAGNVLRVHPDISGRRGFEGEDVVFSVISPYQDSLSGRCEIFDRLNFVFLLFLFEISAAQDTVFYQFFPDIIEIGDFFCVIDKCEHRVKVIDLFFCFLQLDLFFHDSGFRLGVFFKISLSIFRCGIPGVQRDGHHLSGIIVEDFRRVAAVLYGMQTCGEKFSVKPVIFGIFGL